MTDHDLLLVLLRRYRPINALRLAGELICLGGSVPSVARMPSFVQPAALASATVSRGMFSTGTGSASARRS